MKIRTVILAICVLLVGSAAHAQNATPQSGGGYDGVVSHEVTPAESDPGYWTEERMRNAKPMEMLVADPKIYPRACPEDAKICPDGSSVVRVGPNCEFAPCPGEPGYQPPVECTTEARMCPDGTAVGRTGPNCEFAPCPVVGQPYPGAPGYGGGGVDGKPPLAACTRDAKICPDGTAVGRIAPDCEFAPCPGVTPGSPQD